MAKEYPSLKELTYHAVLDTDTDVSGVSWVLDEDDFASDSATKVPTQQSTKAYIQSYVSAHSGRNGATKVTSATDITLTSTSDFFQIIEMTTAGNSVTLPDATDFTDEGWAFIIRSISYDFYIKDYAGTTIFSTSSASGNDMVVMLVDNSSPFGEWVILDQETGNITSVLAGNEEVYNSAGTYANDVCVLPGGEQAIVAYRDNGNSNYGTACILSIDKTVATAGSEYVFTTNSVYGCKIVALSSTSALVVYFDSSNSNYGTAVVLTVSNGTLSAGTPVVFNAGATYSLSVSRLDINKVIVTYQDNGNSDFGTAIILTVSGDVITVGNETVFNAAATGETSVAALSETSAVVCFKDSGNSYYGTACVLSISGTTITAGSETVFYSGNVTRVAVAKLLATKAILAFVDSDNSSIGKAVVLNISGASITVGTATTFSSSHTGDAEITATSDRTAVVCFVDSGNSYYGTACVLSISGTTITAGSKTVFNSGASDELGVASISTVSAITAYQDGGNSNYGTACVLTGAI